MKYVTLLIALIAFESGIFAQSNYELTIKRYQDSISETYENPKTSILSKKQLKEFNGLKFYSINKDYRLNASFLRTPEAVPFNMQLSSGQTREYVQFGIASFQLDGSAYHLPIYQNTHYRDNPDVEYGNSLFLPFTDYTSGDGSYGGGRYLDLVLEDIDNGAVVIDFNKAYNPYCAYTLGYNCPIPPEANDLTYRIEAGVKVFDGLH